MGSFWPFTFTTHKKCHFLRNFSKLKFDKVKKKFLTHKFTYKDKVPCIPQLGIDVSQKDWKPSRNPQAKYGWLLYRTLIFFMHGFILFCFIKFKDVEFSKKKKFFSGPIKSLSRNSHQRSKLVRSCLTFKENPDRLARLVRRIELHARLFILFFK